MVTGFIRIEKAGLADISALRQIGMQTFRETFAAENTAADMQQYLNESFSDERMISELSNPEAFFYLATLGNNIIGYLKLNMGAAQTEPQEDALEIERIYVLREYQGQSVGQLLYEKAMATARDRNLKWLWLGVWEHNHKAIRFYEKNGFTAFDKHIFRLGSDEQTDIMMRKRLS
jgi:ribosomal protein S18 acetylase RimI-like enzyme